MTLHDTNAASGILRGEMQSSTRLRNRVRHESVQIAVIAAVLLLIGLLVYAVKEGLAQKGIKFSYSFLWEGAGFDISEGKSLSFAGGFPSLVDYTSDQSNAAAFFAGVFNTLKVAVLAIVFSTILGTLLGVGRLSTNWLVRNLCFWIVEFVRNTPLLIQLVFWYFAVILRFPPIASAADWYGGLIVSQQGIFFPSLTWNGGGTSIPLVLMTAAWVSVLGAVFDRFRTVRLLCLGIAFLSACALFAGGYLGFEFPSPTKFRISGGSSFSPEMAALLLAIVVNSASYIAEIVRGTIDALPRGQWEAASSLGLSRRSTVNDIILPQVFRVVLPSFGNQYISLTKNTALGIAIGYPDLFNVYGTIANQTGHTMEGIVIVMLSYLILSWAISVLVSFADRRLNKGGLI